jgi:FkbH-like protein
MRCADLYWLPETSSFDGELAALSASKPEQQWGRLAALANTRLGALNTVRLDRRRAKLFPISPPTLATSPVRLAVLASSTVDHLLPAIRVGGLRRQIWIETYMPEYGLYVQDLMNPASALHRFQPNAVLFALDTHHLVQGLEADSDVSRWSEWRVQELAELWGRARQAFGCQIIQNMPLPIFAPLMGENEHRLPWSRAAALRRLAGMLRDKADAEGVDLISLDHRAARDGIASWYDPALWHHAKQEIHPAAAPLYGDLVGRILGAGQGRSFKCLVMDLDNTLWGGVVGDDGISGIKLGQGSAAGEAYAAFQHYARDLGRRGVILAVCSKNEQSNAFEAFEHPEMVLKRDDIACFVANWTDKATNLREIATRLNIGLDSLVFVDDNPAERALVRGELPMVAVPELPEDPSLYGDCVADAGYFEILRVTGDDLGRAKQYQDNLRRETLATSATDLSAFLRGLNMRALWGRFDRVGQARIVQLINKTNQFNLTTRRVTHDEIGALISDQRALTLQIRLLDQFGDNGIVAIVAGRLANDAVRLDIWLMSCRVLGRGLEEETLNLIVAEARRLGASKLIGEYRPSAKNGMVRDHYKQLGFDLSDERAEVTEWTLSLDAWEPRPTHIRSDVGVVPQPLPV